MKTRRSCQWCQEEFTPGIIHDHRYCCWTCRDEARAQKLDADIKATISQPLQEVLYAMERRIRELEEQVQSLRSWSGQ